MIRADEISPASIEGGTWTKIAQGRAIIGASADYPLNGTGGSADAVAVKHGGHVRPCEWETGSLEWEIPFSDNSYLMSIDKVEKYGSGRTFMLEFGNEVGFRTTYRGEDGIGKNMQPYLALNIWQKIAD